MIKVSIVFPNTPGWRFDQDYDRNAHLPLAMKCLVPPAKSVTLDIGVSSATPDQPPPLRAVAAFTCESVQDFRDAFMPHAAELSLDISNYTDIEPIIQISQASELRVMPVADAETSPA